MSVRILLLALLAFSLAACVAPGSRYGEARQDRGSDDRSYADRGQRYQDDYRGDGGQSFVSCGNCGVVQRIEGYSDHRRSSGAGVIVGAIIGGVLGNQVGSGDGRRAATVAGAIGGGFAGNAIENNMSHASYDITVWLNTRRSVVVTQNRIDRDMREGSRVIVKNGRAKLL